jgi:hypothetical protein
MYQVPNLLKLNPIYLLSIIFGTNPDIILFKYYNTKLSISIIYKLYLVILLSIIDFKIFTRGIKINTFYTFFKGYLLFYYNSRFRILLLVSLLLLYLVERKT